MFTVNPEWVDELESDDPVYLIDRWPPARAWLIDRSPRFPVVWRVELHKTGAHDTVHQMFIVPRDTVWSWAEKELTDDE